MAWVEKHRGRWRVCWSEGGRTRTRGGFRTRSEAERARDVVATAVALGQPVERDRRAAPRWDAVETAYLAWYQSRRASGSLAPVTSRLRTAASALRLTYLSDLEEPHLEAMHARLREAGASETYAHGVVVSVLAMQRWACKRPEWRGLLRRLDSIELRAPRPRLDPVAPSWEDCDKAIAHAHGWVRRLMLVQRGTGLRSAQVMHLTWDRVRLDDATLHIAPDLPGSKAIHERAGRIVPIPRWLADEMATWTRDDAFVVDRDEPSGDPRQRRGRSRTRSSSAVRGPWTRAGVDVPQPTHALRKAHATGLLLAGAAPAHIDYLQGRVVHGMGLLGRTYAEWKRLEPLIRPVAELVDPYSPPTHPEPTRPDHDDDAST